MWNKTGDRSWFVERSPFETRFYLTCQQESSHEKPLESKMVLLYYLEQYGLGNSRTKSFEPLLKTSSVIKDKSCFHHETLDYMVSATISSIKKIIRPFGLKIRLTVALDLHTKCSMV